MENNEAAEEKDEEEAEMVDTNNAIKEVFLAMNDVDKGTDTSEEEEDKEVRSPVSNTLTDNELRSPLSDQLADNEVRFIVIEPVMNKDVRFPASRSVTTSNPAMNEDVKEVRVPTRNPPAEPTRTAPNTRGASMPRSRAWVTERWMKFKTVEVIFRAAEAIFSLVAFSVMAANHQIGTELGTKIPFDAKFSDFQAYSYLLAINVLAFVYSTAQLIMWKVSYKQGFSYSPASSWAIGVFICDQMLALLLFSASTSAATVCVLSRKGVGSIWPSICRVWEVRTFCYQAEGAVGISFLASFCAITSALFSGDRFIRSMTN